MEESTPWHAPGKYYASPANYDPELTAERPGMPRRVRIKDVTLREGEETPGVVFSMENRIEIARRLQDIGVAEIEMFRTYTLDETRAMTDAFNRAGISVPRSFVSVSLGPWIEWIDMVCDGGADGVTLLSGWPTGVVWAPGRKTLPKDEFYPRLAEAIGHARRQGLHVSVGAPNTTRAPVHAVIDLCRFAVQSGADRVHLYDSFGIGLPSVVRFLARKVKEAIGETPLLWHGHNDFGQATANTVAAVEGGAEWCDVVVNGLGDRGGNAAFEEVVCSLEVLHGIDTGIRLEKLCELSRFIEEVSGIRLQPNKAIVGKHAFLEESHFMIRKAAEDAGYPEAVLPFVPQLVGASPHLVIGTTNLYVGAIEYLLEKWGLPGDPETVETIRSRVRARLEGGGYLEQDQLHAIAHEVVG